MFVLEYQMIYVVVVLLMRIRVLIDILMMNVDPEFSQKATLLKDKNRYHRTEAVHCMGVINMKRRVLPISLVDTFGVCVGG